MHIPETSQWGSRALHTWLTYAVPPRVSDDDRVSAQQSAIVKANGFYARTRKLGEKGLEFYTRRPALVNHFVSGANRQVSTTQSFYCPFHCQ